MSQNSRRIATTYLSNASDIVLNGQLLNFYWYASSMFYVYQSYNSYILYRLCAILYVQSQLTFIIAIVFYNANVCCTVGTLFHTTSFYQC